MSGFDYVNHTYGLRLKRGTRCIYTGDGLPRLGAVTSSNGSHIRVRFDDDPNRTAGPFHPTWEMEYPAADTETQP